MNQSDFHVYSHGIIIPNINRKTLLPTHSMLEKMLFHSFKLFPMFFTGSYFQFDDVILPKVKTESFYEKGKKFMKSLVGTNGNDNSREGRKKMAERIFLLYLQDWGVCGSKFPPLTLMHYMYDLIDGYYYSSTEHRSYYDKWCKVSLKMIDVSINIKIICSSQRYAVLKCFVTLNY